MSKKTKLQKEQARISNFFKQPKPVRRKMKSIKSSLKSMLRLNRQSDTFPQENHAEIIVGIVEGDEHLESNNQYDDLMLRDGLGYQIRVISDIFKGMSFTGLFLCDSCVAGIARVTTPGKPAKVYIEADCPGMHRQSLSYDQPE